MPASFKGSEKTEIPWVTDGKSVSVKDEDEAFEMRKEMIDEVLRSLIFVAPGKPDPK